MRICIKADSVRLLAARGGWTLSDVADRAGIHATYLSRVLAGIHELSPRKRSALLVALEAQFDELFEVSECEAPSHG
jgi:transcriptional regulator with XRE-family HTH domain